MEAIKNFINPGKKHDDEVLYGSGRSDDPVLSGAGTSQTHGQGSDVGGSDITGNDPRSTATDPTSTSGYAAGKDQHIGTDRPSDSSGVDDRYPSSSLRGPSDDVATTASIKSGVAGKDQSGPRTGPSDTSDTLDTNKPLHKEPTDTAYTGSSIGSSGNPYSASPHNKLDPRVDSDSNPSGAIDHERGTGTGTGLTGNTLPDRTVGSSGFRNDPQPSDSTLGRDAALGAGAVAAGVGTAAALHHKRDQDDLRSDAGRSFPLAGNSDKSGSDIGSTGVTGGTTAGPHSSDLANKVDPRVDSDLDGSNTAGNPGYGSGTGPTPGADHQGSLGRDTQTGPSATTGTVLAGQTPGADHQGSLGRDTQTGSSATTGTLLAGQTPGVDHGPDSWKHDHVTHGHGFVGDPCQHNAGEGSPIFTKGPHATDTANLLDPHVNPSLKTPIASTGASLDSGVGSTPQGSGLHGRDATELGSGTHGHDDRSRGVTGLGSTRHSDDQHSRNVPELGSAAQGGDSYDRGTSGIGSNRHNDDHHGRDVAVAGALGAAGVGAYASSRDDTPSTENPSTSTGPHHSKLLNKLDPRSSKDRPTTTAETSALIGSSGPGSSSHMPTSDTVGTSHENTRGPESVGPAGVGEYESEKHPRGSEQTGTTASATAASDTAAVHEKQDYGQDVRSVGTVGPVDTVGQGSYDTGDTHNDKGRGLTSHLPGFLGGHHEKSTEPTGSKYDETRDSTATDRRIGTEPESGSDHHYGRDAGIASAGIGGGLAAYEAQKLHSRDEPTATTGSSTHPTQGYGDGDRTTDKYSGHDTALTGGVVPGSGAGAESEFSKRDAEQLAEARQKAYEKEQKAIHKEQVKHEKVLEKDEKRHEKEEKKHEKAEKKLEKEEKKHEKEEKKHEKELLVAEKKHEKEERQHEKEEKKHEKELAKEEKKEHDDGKKHGGILGLFHRDKTDKTDNQHENDDLRTNPDGSYRGTETGPDIGDGVQHEKHEPNKLHKDPPAGYYESKGYEPPRTGEASHVTGGAGEEVPGQGYEYPAGSRRTGAGDEDPNVSGGFADPQARAGQGTAVEPHTGLPVNLSKGLGQGGTDGGPNPGYHTHDADAAGVDRSRV